MSEVLIAGCGRLGIAAAGILAKQGHTVYGLRRDTTCLPSWVRPVQADLRNRDSLTRLPAVDHLIYAPTSGARDETAYRATYVEGLANLVSELPRDRLRRLLFVSSTAVYEQDDGAWVNEDTPCRPAGFRSRVMLAAEAQALSGTVLATAIRFAGIYGPEPGALVERVRAGAPCRGRFTNRIHVDDAAAVLVHLLIVEAGYEVVLGVDDAPALDCEVMTWLARRLGVTPPLKPTGAACGKRCRNDRLKQSGFTFRYPDYRAGYRHILSGGEA